MGRNKAELPLAGRPLLEHARQAAERAGLPVRIIRRDLVPRCGPIGGVYTALRTTEAHAVLFLACDMPFVTAALIRGVLSRLTSTTKAVFTRQKEPGFPFALRASAIPEVKGLLEAKEFALKTLARQLKARYVTAPREQAGCNLNTPEDYEHAKRLLET